MSEELWLGRSYATHEQIVKVSDNRPPPSEFEQHSQVVIEGMQRGNRTNWIIHFPGVCVKLCYWSKTKGFFFSFRLDDGTQKRTCIGAFLKQWSY